MAAESTQSTSSQKRRLKRKKTQKDPEFERLDSLPWNSSIPIDDTLSAFIGSNDLEGGLYLFVRSSVCFALEVFVIFVCILNQYCCVCDHYFLQSSNVCIYIVCLLLHDLNRFLHLVKLLFSL